MLVGRISRFFGHRVLKAGSHPLGVTISSLPRKSFLNDTLVSLRETIYVAERPDLCCDHRYCKAYTMTKLGLFEPDIGR